MSSVQGVLDLSFFDIAESTDVITSIELREKEMKKAVQAKGNRNQSPTKDRSNSSKVELIKALRISNNNIADLKIVLSPLSEFSETQQKSSNKTEGAEQTLESPVMKLHPGIGIIINFDKVLWLDASFNFITSISVEFLEAMPNLSTLNLHSNRITKLSDIKKLANLKHLRNLTLCGNPVCENKHYRNLILYTCGTRLVQLDFGAITAAERMQMDVWAQVFRKKLNPDDY